MIEQQIPDEAHEMVKWGYEAALRVHFGTNRLFTDEGVSSVQVVVEKVDDQNNFLGLVGGYWKLLDGEWHTWFVAPHLNDPTFEDVMAWIRA